MFTQRMKMYKNSWKLINIIFFGGVLVVNYLANSLPLGGRTTGEISNNFPLLFTPPGYVFSIWGIIYLSLLGFIIYQALPSGKAAGKNLGSLFALSCIFNITWLFAWHYAQIVLSTVIMLAFLITLILIYSRINKESTSNRDSGYFWFAQVPFSLYLGWVAIASIANINIFLYHINLSSLGVSIAWTTGLIVLGLIVALLTLKNKQDIVFGLVFVWAFLGIGIKYWGDIFTLQITAIGAAAIIFAFITSIGIKKLTI